MAIKDMKLSKTKPPTSVKAEDKKAEDYLAGLRSRNTSFRKSSSQLTSQRCSLRGCGGITNIIIGRKSEECEKVSDERQGRISQNDYNKDLTCIDDIPNHPLEKEFTFQSQHKLNSYSTLELTEEPSDGKLARAVRQIKMEPKSIQSARCCISPLSMQRLNLLVNRIDSPSLIKNFKNGRKKRAQPMDL